MKQLFKFLGRAPADRRFLLEALAWLCWAELLLLLVPFRWIAPRLGRVTAQSPLTINDAERQLALRVSWAVQSIARHVPLRFVCLPQAIAAKWMLRRRGLPSTLYLGLRPGGALKLSAHAWLRVGDQILTGRAGSFNHEMIATFAEAGG